MAFKMENQFPKLYDKHNVSPKHTVIMELIFSLKVKMVSMTLGQETVYG